MSNIEDDFQISEKHKLAIELIKKNSDNFSIFDVFSADTEIKEDCILRHDIEPQYIKKGASSICYETKFSGTDKVQSVIVTTYEQDNICLTDDDKFLFVVKIRINKVTRLGDYVEYVKASYVKINEFNKDKLSLIIKQLIFELMIEACK